MLSTTSIILCCLAINYELNSFTKVRHGYLSSKRDQTISRLATILLSNIPASILSILDKRGIYEVFKDLAPEFQGIILHRDCEDLAKLIRVRDAAVEACEKTLTIEIATSVRDHVRPAKSRTTERFSSRKIASRFFPILWQLYQKYKTECFGLSGLHHHQTEGEVLIRLTDSINKANYKISELQSNPSRLPLLKSAFLIFKTSRTAKMASRLLVSDCPREMTLQFVGCSAENIIWPAVGTSWVDFHLRTLAVRATPAALCIGWTIPVAFTGVISQVSYLTRILPWLEPLSSLTVWCGRNYTGVRTSGSPDASHRLTPIAN